MLKRRQRLRRETQRSVGRSIEMLEARRVLAVSLAITEVNYAPYGPIAEFGDIGDRPGDFEFIEVMNTGSSPINMQGIAFTQPTNEGVSFSFPALQLDPLQRVVVVENLDSFRSRYGDGPLVAGQWRGGLRNSGEILTLETPDGNTILQFEYDTGGDWPSRANGIGASLELVEPIPADVDYSDGDSWNSSSKYGGTPGAPPASRFSEVVVNEVLAHTDLPEIDFVELYNVTDRAIDISGWYLADEEKMDNDTPFVFSIPDGTVIQPNGYALLSEQHFNVSGNPDIDIAFSETGDEVWLFSAEENGRPDRFMDRVRFGPTFNGVTIGRIPDGNLENNNLHPLGEETLGRSNLLIEGDLNSAHFRGNIVITEIHYHPPEMPPNPNNPLDKLTDEVYKEFVELINTSPFDTEWVVTGAVGVEVLDVEKFRLKAGQTAVLVAFDPESDIDLAHDFRVYHGISEAVNLVGPWESDGDGPDRLGDAGETLTLRQPVEDGFSILQIPIDKISYDDRDPWPLLADGQGGSLNRRSTDHFGYLAESWFASTPTPGNEPIDLTKSPELNLDSVLSGRIDRDGRFVRGTTDVDVYRFTPATSGDFIVQANSVAGSLTLDTYLRVFASDGETELAANDNVDESTTNSELTVSLSASQEYYVTVAGSGPGAQNYVPATGRGLAVGSVGPYELSITASDVNPTPWHNTANPLDVDNNGVVTPLDALYVINALNDVGPGVLAFDANAATLISPITGNRFFVDVDATISPNILSPLDALQVINKLNEANPAATRAMPSSTPLDERLVASAMLEDVNSLDQSETDATTIALYENDAEDKKQRPRWLS